MSRTRPYFARFQGKDYIIIAVSQEQAQGHLTKPLFEAVHAASASEVAVFAANGGTIMTAGVYPEEKSGEGVDRILGGELDVSDARAWFLETLPEGPHEDQILFDEIRDAGEMGVSAYEAIAKVHPRLAEILTAETSHAALKGELKKEAMKFEDLVAVIHDQIRRERAQGGDQN